MADGRRARSAQAVMDGDVLLKKYRPDKDAKRLMAMIDQGVGYARRPSQAFNDVQTLLQSNEDLPDHRSRSLACIDG